MHYHATVFVPRVQLY